MTITVDPAAVAAFIGILLTAAGGFIGFGKLSSRIDILESDVKQILGMLNTHLGYHQGLMATGDAPDESD